MEKEKNKEKGEDQRGDTTYMGVCDYPVCNFYTDCKDYDTVNKLCEEHMRTHSGHNATAIPC